MLSGTAALAILFALITDALISARLARVLGANIPRGLHDHVVVCGLGNIGYRMVEQLHDLGVPIVAAELHETNRYLPAVRRLGVPVLVADIRLPETLEVLHVGRARSVVVVTSSDIVNLETALNIQALNPDIRVVQRLFDPDLAARVERAFGFHISRSPSALAAPGLRRRRGRRARAGHDRGRGGGPGRGPPPGRAGLPGRGPHRGRAGGRRRQPGPAPVLTAARPELAPRRRHPTGRRRRAGRGRPPRPARPHPGLDRDRRPRHPPPLTQHPGGRPCQLRSPDSSATPPPAPGWPRPATWGW